jgi:hypothetical protein
MMKKINKLFLGILLLLVLAMVGCGGGGGGSTAVKNFKSWSQVEPDSTYQLNGLTLEINEDGIQNLSDKSTLRFAKDSNEQWTNLTIKTPSSTVSFSKKANDSIIDDPNSPYVFAQGVNDDKYAIALNPYDLGWNYQTYGLWAVDPINDQGDSFGFISAGAPTPANAALPQGQATYVGSTIGGYYNALGEAFVTQSNLEVTADFNDLSWYFVTSQTKSLDKGDDLSILDMTGNLRYQSRTNRYSGDVFTSSGLTGKADGRFYGPRAEELGGVFETRSLDQQEFYGGAFGGAKR